MPVQFLENSNFFECVLLVEFQIPLINNSDLHTPSVQYINIFHPLCYPCHTHTFLLLRTQNSNIFSFLGPAHKYTHLKARIMFNIVYSLVRSLFFLFVSFFFSCSSLVRRNFWQSCVLNSLLGFYIERACCTWRNSVIIVKNYVMRIPM